MSIVHVNYVDCGACITLSFSDTDDHYFSFTAQPNGIVEIDKHDRTGGGAETVEAFADGTWKRVWIEEE